MKTLDLEFPETAPASARSYPIHIGEGLLAKPDLIRSHLSEGRVAVVSNEIVAPLYLDQVLEGLSAFHPLSVVLPDGEQYKTLEGLNRIIDALLKAHCDRSTTLIALGGGVVGDMTGFAAACYQRGVPFIQLPTSLLAQVDSSVGGKTGVNHALGKNMIGAFYQPRCVVVDIDTLKTLPDKELSAGLAEIIKYGLIRDLEFFQWLETNVDRILARDQEALGFAIHRSCLNKAEVVKNDEREAGIRALLNFGHTFGHAIETGLGYGVWLHGQAVAAGMALAADLSRRLGWIDADANERIERLLHRARLPSKLPDAVTPRRLLELMSVDKKIRGGRLRFVLLKAIGEAVITDEVPAGLLDETLGLTAIATKGR